ncbi:DUF1501 domain-containing protein [Flavisphingomonas formosensis]|uniref:DUF1501 domain-containing protein n=1 Tax=Flavisphingomonas formosensis TaxID=861534 RepID=UPI0012FC3FF2|nr:DUF1501 domain-containing protein [Sphingomonas formosensis]
MNVNRRQILYAGLTGGALLLAVPSLLPAHPPGDRRLIFIIQRGALDGLQAVPPVGDPDFGGMRGVLGEVAGVQKLDSMFGLHPSLAGVGKIYAQKQALFVHAVASPYRDRSHFDGQNVLESGGLQPFDMDNGWLNRLMGLESGLNAVSLSAGVPLALAGPNTVASFEPAPVGRINQPLLDKVSALYADDAQLHPLWEEAVDTRKLAYDIQQGEPKTATQAERLARLTTGFLKAPNGPRIAMIETQQWDTHTQQISRLKNQLSQFDLLLTGLQAGLGDMWKNTLVIAATEFGRTVSINGTGGTDHGTGSVAMLFGGTVAGGRVVADWPGLKRAQQQDGRDLKPTTDLHAVISGAVADHFGLPPSKVAQTLFPERSVTPLRDLIRT